MTELLKTGVFYDFGAYRLDAAQRVLLRSGEPVSLTPRAFDVLHTLVSRNGQIVEKDDLMKAVWAETFVEESNLTYQISVLRKALGDGYIETVPKRGYRFTRIETPPEAAAIESAQPVQPAKPPRPSVFRTVLIVAAVIAVAFLIHAFLPLWSPVRSIAVLPFKSPEGMDELGIGLTDALIMRLGNSEQLHVRPTSAIYRYQNKSVDPAAAGKQLGVDAVVEGMLQRSGNRMRATLQLVRVSDGKHLMSSQFDYESTDLFALEDGLSQQLSQALATRLSGAQRANLAKRPDTNPEAHRLVLLGRYHHRRQTPANMRQAISAFQQAIEKDDRYAPAWSGLSLAYFGLCYRNGMDARLGMPKAATAALRALELDSNLAEAHAAQAFVQMWFEYDLKSARTSWERALQLDPEDHFALEARALDALFLGRFAESIAIRRKILESNPVDPFDHVLLAASLYYSGAYEEALATSKKALELDPNFTAAYQSLSIIYRLLGRIDESVQAYLRERELSGSDAAATEALRQAYAKGGLRAWDQLRYESALDRLRKGQPVSALGLATLARDVGHFDEALDWLDKAYEERAPNLMVIKTFPPWKPMLPLPRFQAMIARLGLK